MRQTLTHIAKLVSVFAFGVCLSSAFNYLVVSSNFFNSPTPVADESTTESTAAVAPIPTPVAAPRKQPTEQQLSALAPASAPVPAGAPASPRDMKVVVRKGDTLTGVLERGGISAAEALEISGALQGTVAANSIQAGQEMQVSLESSAKNPQQLAFKELKIPYTEKLIAVTRKDDGKLDVSTTDKPLKKQLVRTGAPIYDSLMGAAEGIGVPGSVMQSIINAYSYDVDFQRDIQAGDRFEVVYESMQDENGHHVRSGDVLYAQLTLSGVAKRVYYFTDNSGNGSFYTEDGHSVKRALLKTPINGARITSGFGMRMHPVLGYSKMHRGIDFAAPIGTPIYAAGDGRVVDAGRKGTYGNYLRIRHNGEYSTAYAHLSRFAPGIHGGTRVKQGQVVAYVGTTGRSTGPHLHFELIRGNTQINPNSVKSMASGALSKPEMVRFKRQQERLRQEMASLPMQNQLASLK